MIAGLITMHRSADYTPYQLGDVIDYPPVTATAHGQCLRLDCMSLVQSTSTLRFALALLALAEISMLSFPRRYTNLRTWIRCTPSLYAMQEDPSN